MRDMIEKRSDALLGGVLLAVCGFLTWAALQIRGEESKLLPLFAIGVIALSAVWLIFRTLVLHKSATASLLHNRRELTVWVMFVGLVFLIPRLGFYSSSFLFLLVCYLYLSFPVTKKTAIRAFAYAAAVTLALFICFTLVVRMTLPRGLLI